MLYYKVKKHQTGLFGKKLKHVYLKYFKNVYLEQINTNALQKKYSTDQLLIRG